VSNSLAQLLSSVEALTEPLAWLVTGLFVLTVLATTDSVSSALQGSALSGDARNVTRWVGAVAWAAFGVFWATLVPYYLFEMQSPIEGLGSLLAVPACLYAGWLYATRHEQLQTFTRAVAIMALVYLPVQAVGPLRGLLVESVAGQTHAVITMLGFEPTLTAGPAYGYQSRLVFDTDGQRYATYIEPACTALGSMAIFAGLIGAVRAPLSRRLRALALALTAIFVLNILRNVFIALAFGKQWFQWFVPELVELLGHERPGLVSFFIADRVIAQSLSVLALLAIAWLVSRDLPELLTLGEDLLSLLTGREYDLHTEDSTESTGVPERVEHS